MAYLDVVLPRHIGIGMLAAVDGEGLLLEGRCDTAIVVKSGPLTVLHLERIDGCHGYRQGSGEFHERWVKLQTLSNAPTSPSLLEGSKRRKNER